MLQSFFGRNYKRILPLTVFVLLLIPIATSSLLDVKQKRENEIRLEEERIQKEELEVERKIYLIGKFDPTIRKDFILIPSQYVASGASQSKMHLREETLEAYIQMQKSAESDGVDLKIASATRNFEYQKGLWDKKWKAFTLFEGPERFKKILEYSSVPGASRHHWGTEIDINDATPEYFDTKKGKREYEWLKVNAAQFGFCQTYNKKGEDRLTGYNEEKWHWSYLPISQNLTEEYKSLITDENINGFLGDEYVENFNLINDYVLSINPDCL